MKMKKKKIASSQDDLNSELTDGAGKTRGEQTHKAASFPLLFTEGYDYRAPAIFLSVSASFPLDPSPLLVLSISAHDLADAAEARLNCAISYMFTLLASF